MGRPRSKTLKPGMPESRVLMGSLQACRFWCIDVKRQNTGGMMNDKGRYVAFGVKGDSDIAGTTEAVWGPLRGRTVHIECKREGWKPPRPPKSGKVAGPARLRWEAQVARLRKTNANGGYGFWSDDPEYTFRVLELLRRGCTIEIGDDDHCVVVMPNGAST
ncbi:hypothetical protein [Paludisphaera mucosa]|uniref:Uncharacterized protein n=1 Tax=Paludisphaera mucosa TaxID=3030827 RepID=A0ABT6F6S9_9BACT|nr:hypothetical protein [Paludisphaera mucosa]MDG3003264.1 hypothetical protein [Paludisphaera mucosa]